MIINTKTEIVKFSAMGIGVSAPIVRAEIGMARDEARALYNAVNAINGMVANGQLAFDTEGGAAGMFERISESLGAALAPLAPATATPPATTNMENPLSNSNG